MENAQKTIPGESLKKDERLRGDKAVQQLFARGKSAFSFPFRYYWQTVAADEAGGPPVAVLFSVPKKLVRRAVKRNLIKRRMREAYRRNKTLLTVPVAVKGRRVEIALIYSSKDIPDFKIIENGIRRILAEIAKGI